MCVVLLVTLSRQGTASAQASAPEPAPTSTRAAADAYDKGAARYALHDYASAADWFELADRLAPDASALESAIRAHRQAGAPAHLARAATLALALGARYPKDRVAARVADEVIASATPSMARITLRCDECRLDVDGAPEPGNDAFVTPGEHRIVIHRPGVADVSKTVEARASTVEVVGVPIEQPTTEAPPAPVAPRPVEERPPARALSPAFAIGGALLTGVLGGATAISWFADALPAGRRLLRDARTTHRTDPDQEDRVSAAETRTSVLLAAAATTGIVTIVLGTFFTRWRDQHAISASSLAGGRGFDLRASF